MIRSSMTCFILLLAPLLGGSNRLAGQERQFSLIEVAQKAETSFKGPAYRDYYVIEISRDESRQAKQGEVWYQVWARTDSVVPRFAAIAMSSRGVVREMDPPAVMQALAIKQVRPGLPLVEALSLAERYAKDLGASGALRICYLIAPKGVPQRWHVLGKDLSLFVSMDGRVKRTGDM